MGSIGRYIFRTTLGAFLVVLASVTTLMWITRALRGFVGMLACTHVPAALLVPYGALTAALAFGYWGISRGVVIEPSAFIVDAITGFLERTSRRSARLRGQTR
jgi:hypothetical protein